MWALVEAHFGCTGAVRYGFSDRLAVGCLRKQPTGGDENRRLGSQKSVRINLQSRSPISFRGHLMPLSRRSYQPENRFPSVSRPFLNVSGAASPLRPGTSPELRWRGFTKQQRSACGGSNYDWIMRVGAERGAELTWDVVEYGRD